MDMSLIADGGSSPVEKIAIVATLLFLIGVLPVAVQRRRLGVTLTLVPLLVNVVAAYLQLRWVVVFVYRSNK